jgi:hypothetical protein
MLDVETYECDCGFGVDAWSFCDIEQFFPGGTLVSGAGRDNGTAVREAPPSLANRQMKVSRMRGTPPICYATASAPIQKHE